VTSPDEMTNPWCTTPPNVLSMLSSSPAGATTTPARDSPTTVTGRSAGMFDSTNRPFVTKTVANGSENAMPFVIVGV
jgi:hypothetical protein